MWFMTQADIGGYTLVDNPAWGLADRLRKSRQLADMEQADIAEALGCARNTVSNWERGRSEPSATYFVRWARATGVSLDWLAGAVNDETPAEAGALPTVSTQGAPRGIRTPNLLIGSPDGFWTPERSLNLASLWCQVDPDSEIANAAGVAL